MRRAPRSSSVPAVATPGAPPDHAHRLSGRTAMITGAGSRGIGSAIAQALAAAGADVALHYRGSVEGAEAAAARIRRSGRAAFTIQADLANPGEARKAVREVITRFGRLDILVANAAAVSRTPFLEITDDEWDRVVNTNLRGYFVCVQEAARDMMGRRAGRIIMVSSVNQQIVHEGLAHYCASKGGIMQLAKAAALELAPSGVTVNLLCPGTIETDLNRTALSDQAFRRIRLDPIPLGRIGVPEDLAGAAVFLASDESAYMTGASIFVDGGRSLS